jgi:hypothetical protein
LRGDVFAARVAAAAALPEDSTTLKTAAAHSPIGN